MTTAERSGCHACGDIPVSSRSVDHNDPHTRNSAEHRRARLEAGSLRPNTIDALSSVPYAGGARPHCNASCNDAHRRAAADRGSAMLIEDDTGGGASQSAHTCTTSHHRRARRLRHRGDSATRPPHTTRAQRVIERAHAQREQREDSASRIASRHCANEKMLRGFGTLTVRCDVA